MKSNLSLIQPLEYNKIFSSYHNKTKLKKFPNYNLPKISGLFSQQDNNEHNYLYVNQSSKILMQKPKIIDYFDKKNNNIISYPALNSSIGSEFFNQSNIDNVSSTMYHSYKFINDKVNKTKYEKKENSPRLNMVYLDLIRYPSEKYKNMINIDSFYNDLDHFEFKNKNNKKLFSQQLNEINKKSISKFKSIFDTNDYKKLKKDLIDINNISKEIIDKQIEKLLNEKNNNKDENKIINDINCINGERAVLVSQNIFLDWILDNIKHKVELTNEYNEIISTVWVKNLVYSEINELQNRFAKFKNYINFTSYINSQKEKKLLKKKSLGKNNQSNFTSSTLKSYFDNSNIKSFSNSSNINSNYYKNETDKSDKKYKLNISNKTNNNDRTMGFDFFSEKKPRIIMNYNDKKIIPINTPIQNFKNSLYQSKNKSKDSEYKTWFKNIYVNNPRSHRVKNFINNNEINTTTSIKSMNSKFPIIPKNIKTENNIKNNNGNAIEELIYKTINKDKKEKVNLEKRNTVNFIKTDNYLNFKSDLKTIINKNSFTPSKELDVKDGEDIGIKPKFKNSFIKNIIDNDNNNKNNKINNKYNIKDNFKDNFRDNIKDIIKDNNNDNNNNKITKKFFEEDIDYDFINNYDKNFNDEKNNNNVIKDYEKDINNKEKDNDYNNNNKDYNYDNKYYNKNIKYNKDNNYKNIINDNKKNEETTNYNLNKKIKRKKSIEKPYFNFIYEKKDKDKEEKEEEDKNKNISRKKEKRLTNIKNKKDTINSKSSNNSKDKNISKINNNNNNNSKKHKRRNKSIINTSLRIKGRESKTDISSQKKDNKNNNISEINNIKINKKKDLINSSSNEEYEKETYKDYVEYEMMKSLKKSLIVKKERAQKPRPSVLRKNKITKNTDIKNVLHKKEEEEDKNSNNISIYSISSIDEKEDFSENEKIKKEVNFLNIILSEKECSDLFNLILAFKIYLRKRDKTDEDIKRIKSRRNEIKNFIKKFFEILLLEKLSIKEILAEKIHLLIYQDLEILTKFGIFTLDELVNLENIILEKRKDEVENYKKNKNDNSKESPFHKRLRKLKSLKKKKLNFKEEKNKRHSLIYNNLYLFKDNDSDEESKIIIKKEIQDILNTDYGKIPIGIPDTEAFLVKRRKIQEDIKVYDKKQLERMLLKLKDEELDEELFLKNKKERELLEAELEKEMKKEEIRDKRIYDFFAKIQKYKKGININNLDEINTFIDQQIEQNSDFQKKKNEERLNYFIQEFHINRIKAKYNFNSRKKRIAFLSPIIFTSPNEKCKMIRGINFIDNSK